jgi:hypothetical protein
MSVVAEEERAGAEQFPPVSGAVLKRAGYDHGDRDGRVPFFEGAVARAGGTDHVADRPTVAAGEHAGGGISRLPLHVAPGNGVLEIQRNFCQENVSGEDL